jgi:hypothetical protein
MHNDITRSGTIRAREEAEEEGAEFIMLDECICVACAESIGDLGLPGPLLVYLGFLFLSTLEVNVMGDW